MHLLVPCPTGFYFNYVTGHRRRSKLKANCDLWDTKCQMHHPPDPATRLWNRLQMSTRIKTDMRWQPCLFINAPAPCIYKYPILWIGGLIVLFRRCRWGKPDPSFPYSTSFLSVQFASAVRIRQEKKFLSNNVEIRWWRARIQLPSAMYFLWWG